MNEGFIPDRVNARLVAAWQSISDKVRKHVADARFDVVPVRDGPTAQALEFRVTVGEDSTSLTVRYYPRTAEVVFRTSGREVATLPADTTTEPQIRAAMENWLAASGL